MISGNGVAAKDVLDGLQFGEGVAEWDKGLENYFIRTPAFRRIVRDDAHLILGAKGSGKTAIVRILSSGKFDIPELQKVDVIAASDTQTSTLFSTLPESADESLMRQIWIAYLLSVTANHVLTVRPGTGRADQIERLMSEAGLSPSPDQQPDTTMRELLSHIPANAGDPIDDGHISVQGPSARRRWIRPEYDFTPIMQALTASFEEVDRVCWILLDRLDEAFHENPKLEPPALRGLLRAHLDLVFYGEIIRTKIFLRSDIFDRVTQGGGFRNLDHLPPVRCIWRRSNAA